MGDRIAAVFLTLFSVLPSLAAVIGGIALIGFAIDKTNEPNCLWALVLVGFVAVLVYPHGLQLRVGDNEPLTKQKQTV